MKRIAVLMLLSCSLFAQTSKFNLSGLKSMRIEIADDYNALNKQTQQRLISECKYKLTSVGVRVDENKPIATLLLRIEVNKSTGFPDPRVLLSLETREKVQTFRDQNIRTEVISYYNSALLTVQAAALNETVYNFFIDKLFLEFINQWIEDNPK